MNDKPNLILTTAANYGWRELEPFFTSLQFAEYKDEIVIFVNNIKDDAVKNLNKLGIKLIPFQRVGLEHQIHINDYRYYLYLLYLKSNHDKYNKILLSDVRDVIFQKDPFSFTLLDDNLIVALEAEKLIGNEVFNTSWILTKFGNYIFDLLRNNIISCAGTTIGSQNEIIKYLELMLRHMFSSGYFQRLDQGIHNFLIYTGKLGKIYMSNNVNGPIMTIGLEDNIQLNERGLILTRQGNVAHIVHQYDRHDKIVQIVNKLYRSTQ